MWIVVIDDTLSSSTFCETSLREVTYESEIEIQYQGSFGKCFIDALLSFTCVVSKCGNDSIQSCWLTCIV